MINFFVIFFFVAISISTTESISWCFTIAHHSRWLSNHPDYERRVAIEPKVLLMLAIISCMFSLMSWTWFMHLIALYFLNSLVISYKAFTCFTLILGIQILSITMWSMISKFICLPGMFWPVLSKMRSKLNMSIISPSASESYLDSLKEWREIHIAANDGKSLIVNFLNNLPVIVWTKSINRKYTFMSNYFYARFGLDPYTSLVGKTGKEVADTIIKADPSFEGTTFDEDELRLFEEQTQLVAFVELTVQGKPISFQVINVPMYKDDELIGLIGIARETTWEVEQMNKIHNLFLKNRINEGIMEFEKFINETREYKYIEEGMNILKRNNGNIND